MSIATHALTPDLMAEMLDVLSDAVIAIDEQHTIVYFNQGSEMIFGYTSREILGQPLAMLLPLRFLESHHRHIEGFAHSSSISRQMGERRELVGRRKSGEEFPAAASIAKLRKNSQRYYAVVLRDISDRKQQENELQHKNKQLAISTERNRLARDLHDGLAQTLGYLKMRVGQITRWVELGQIQSAHHALGDLSSTINTAYNELRHALDALRHSIPEEIPAPPTAPDFLQALRQVAEVAAKQGSYRISVNIDNNARLSAEVEAQLLRIAQEALSNVRKHACADQVWLRFSNHLGQICMVIEDDGCGFDPQPEPLTDHYGLRSMHERASQIGADLEISSMFGGGTRVMLTLASPTLAVEPIAP